MTRVQFYGAQSLDGYLATPDDRIDWLTELPGIPTDAGTATLAQMSVGIMGRVTYQTIQKLAPGSPINPANPQMTSYVITQAQLATPANVVLTTRDPVRLVRKLLQTQSGNIWLIGGSGILTPLLAADLVDDLYLQIAPLLLGHGKRLFGELVAPQQFHLTQAHALGPLAELIYQR